MLVYVKINMGTIYSNKRAIYESQRILHTTSWGHFTCTIWIKIARDHVRRSRRQNPCDQNHIFLRTLYVRCYLVRPSMCTLYLRPIRSVDALHTLYLRLSTRYDAILIQAFCSTNLRHSDDLSAIYPRKCTTSADQGSILADLYTYELKHSLNQSPF